MTVRAILEREQFPMTDEQIRERFLAYLDQNLATPRRSLGRIALHAGFCALGLLFIGLAFSSEAVANSATGLLLLAAGAYRLAPLLRTMRLSRRRRATVENGRPVLAALVQANQDLFTPGDGPRYCLVVFSFETGPEDLGYLTDLASRIFSLKGVVQSDPDLALVSQMVTDERAALYRRRQLPLSFTGGRVVYAADLLIVRSYLRERYLDRRILPCLAAEAPDVGLELIPDWLMEEVSRSGRRPDWLPAPQRPRLYSPN